MLSPAEQEYLRELVTRLDVSLPGLAGAYLFGSGAYGDHDPRRSDLDVQAVVDRAPQVPVLAGLVDVVRHGALSCPARRLELVVYPRNVVARPRPPLAFALNLNTGAHMTDRVATDASTEEPHWFVLDVAAGRETGVPLLGPPVQELFGPLAPADVLNALAASLAWHLRDEPTAPDSVLNACRAWHHAVTGGWASKRRAAEWVLARRVDLGVVGAALAAREDGCQTLPSAPVMAVVEEAASVVAARRQVAVQRLPLSAR